MQWITKLASLRWITPVQCMEETRDILLRLQHDRDQDDLEVTIKTLNQVIRQIRHYQKSEAYDQDLEKLCTEFDEIV